MTIEIALASFRGVVWAILFLFFGRHWNNQPKSYKIFVVYLATAWLTTLSDYLYFINVDNIWLKYVFLVIQAVLLNLFYISLLKSQKRRPITIVFAVLLFLLLLVTAIPSIRIASDYAIYSIVSLMFLMLTTQGLLLFYEHIQAQSKDFFFFNIGLIVFLIISAIVAWIFLLFVNIFGGKPVFSNFYMGANFVCELVYFVFIVLEFKNRFLGKP